MLGNKFRRASLTIRRANLKLLNSEDVLWQGWLLRRARVNQHRETFERRYAFLTTTDIVYLKMPPRPSEHSDDLYELPPDLTMANVTKMDPASMTVRISDALHL